MTPVPGAGLEGYVDSPGFVAGTDVDLRLSGPEGAARLEVLRLTDGDSGLHIEGYGADHCEWGEPRQLVVTPRRIDFGNFVEVLPSPELHPAGDFTFAAWVFPTLVSQGWHAVASSWSETEIGWGLFLGGGNGFKAAVSTDGEQATWCTSATPFVEAWQLVALVWRAAEGELAVLQIFPSDEDSVATNSVRAVPGAVHRVDAPFLIGALGPDVTGVHWAHFNGRIARPRLFDYAMPRDSLLAEMSAPEPERVIAVWDFSADPSSDLIRDTGPSSLHGHAYNAPKRMVAGPTRRQIPPHLVQVESPRYRWADRPHDYDAIHFHDDALADARWPATATVRIPQDAKPGVFAAHVTREVDELFVPFVVEAAEPTADLLFIPSTLTWQAYSTNRMVFSSTPCGVIDRGVCRYDLHSDGSTNYNVAWRRPTRTLAPHLNRTDYGANQLAADMFLIGWLEREDIAYDVLTEHSLHARGHAALKPYRCVALGAHPEYWTRPMIDALQSFLASSESRLIHLGGNALDSVTSLDQDSLVMECRNDISSMLEPSTPRRWPAESQHSTDGVSGNRPWNQLGVAVHELLGTETAALAGRQQTTIPSGYRRTKVSFESRNAWVFEGVQEQMIGMYGSHYGTAAGYEGDAVPSQALRLLGSTEVLAQARAPTIGPLTDYMEPTMDLALTRHHSGAAAFSAGSMTWTGALAHRNGDNDVARITANVFERFLSKERP